MTKPMILRYSSLVSVPYARELTMGEGDTPLIKLEHLSKCTGNDIYIKHEGANPTGSFKDRGMIVAIGRAKQRNATGVLCASTGNTAASAAAYAARAGLKCGVVLPKGAVAASKVAQALAYGATVVTIDGDFDRCLEIVRQLSGDEWVIVNSINPDRIEGQATLAYEVIESIGVPDICVLPVGNAGNITAIWSGFGRWPHVSDRPKMIGVQAEGAAPFISGGPIDNPDTVASAIRIGSPASWDTAWEAVKESGGQFVSVADDELIKWGQRVARQDGIAAEPASMASIAGLMSMDWGRGKTIVAVLTGHVLKDPTVFIDNDLMIDADADVDAVAQALGGS